MIPKVSVIMPVYNGQAFLRESIESILNQTFKDFEFIIIDDGSTDETPEILNEYLRIDKRIKILRNNENIKIVYSLNKGLKAAKTNIIARMDCGDISENTRLEKQYQFLMENVEVVLVGTQCYFITSNGEIRSKSNFPYDDFTIRKELFLKNNIIIHPSVMFRWDSDIWYREFAYPAEDYDFWLRLAHRGKFAILNEYLLKVRLNPDGTTFSGRIQQMKKVEELHQLLIERLKFYKELSITHKKPEDQRNPSNLARSFEYLFKKITSQVISSKKGSPKWLFFAVLAYLSYPTILYGKIKYYIKKKWIHLNPLFVKFLIYEK